MGGGGGGGVHDPTGIIMCCEHTNLCAFYWESFPNIYQILGWDQGHKNHILSEGTSPKEA